ncbi:TetR/AcrR family transcriptional regulator [Streptomyces adelaidensis]|uniref:TetR/AcrR family transcriptional regulator n=1 Tax=Streptomyces adelaidensis TaxID=2796465 RepID=UPI0019087E71|nr:TetR/AcrR family transcriptional regulator [Streptomyces adelaidensis]
MSTEALSPQQRAALTKTVRTRKWLADTARALLDENGWYGVTREDVAKASGFGLTTLSKHFPTKRGLVIAAYAPLVLPLIEKTRNTPSLPGPVLTTFIRELAEICAAHPALAVALLPVARDARVQNNTDESAYDLTLRELAELIVLPLSGLRDEKLPVEVAEYHLLGLLSWIENHPEIPGTTAAELALSQLNLL